MNRWTQIYNSDYFYPKVDAWWRFLLCKALNEIQRGFRHSLCLPSRSLYSSNRTYALCIQWKLSLIKDPWNTERHFLSNHSTTDIWGWKNLCCGELSYAFRVVSSIPGLHWLDVRINPPCALVTTCTAYVVNVAPGWEPVISVQQACFPAAEFCSANQETEAPRE